MTQICILISISKKCCLSTSGFQRLSGHELLIIIITRHVIVQSNQTISLPYHTLCMQLFVEILSKNAPFARQIWLIGTIVQHAIGSKQSRGNRDATRVEK